MSVPNQTIAKLFHYNDGRLDKEFERIYDFLQFAKYPDESIDGKALKLGSVPEDRLRPIISKELVEHPDPTPAQPGYFVGDTVTVDTTSYTLQDKDRTLIVDDDTAGGDVTITLGVGAKHREVMIKKTGSTGKVTLGGTVDGQASPDIIFQNDGVQLVSDGSAWWIV